ncbi:glycoside hydrolase family 57 protein [Candidatus Saccharibacteria bacterium]|nr:glycoside hydrolase family 57 protein [Candidatus Saccharibacteria bacterium]MBH1972680.1 glycoside hydrolase family 57 protein [Candidatus Saccharibacteria bacterium]MBH1990882.1 glycoside hydrolase family 57 protein [Candidatus Saccharibacteria bacterium]OGL23397.1 MAG: alpha-amylase [Candidatus Saccharibacteria bacterium RIFCSPHIGHO2_01_FULL_46_30]
MSQKKAITLYLHVHQPFRVRQYSVFDTGESHDYFNEPNYNSERNNEAVFKKVADKSYRPMNALLLKLLREHKDFKLSLSITGTFIDQAEQWAPDVIESFQALVATGKVEIVAETYHHSLAFFYSRNEFEKQVTLHRDKIKTLFGVTPKVFRNTELAYNNELAQWADSQGYEGILAEGWDPILQWRSPNYVYRPPATKNISLLLKNYRLSDDLAFRFSDQSWGEWPLTADRYTDWLRQATEDAPLVNLFMDYETFGEHQWHETGIFGFFEETVRTWLQDKDNTFTTVSDAITTNPPSDEIDVPYTVTWADTERDLSAWNGNRLQQEALKYLYRLESDILRTKDEQLINDWRYLQASDLVYYMCTKNLDDGAVHAYFSPYESPYDAFLFFMNVIRDLRWRLIQDHKTGGLHG